MSWKYIFGIKSGTNHHITMTNIKNNSNTIHTGLILTLKSGYRTICLMVNLTGQSFFTESLGHPCLFLFKGSSEFISPYREYTNTTLRQCLVFNIPKMTLFIINLWTKHETVFISLREILLHDSSTTSRKTCSTITTRFYEKIIYIYT